MCYLGIGYLGDAFVEIVQSLSPVRSVNSWSTRHLVPCVKHKRTESIVVGAVAQDSRSVSYELNLSFWQPIWCSGMTRIRDGEPARS